MFVSTEILEKITEIKPLLDVEGMFVCQRCGRDDEKPIVGDWYIERFDHNGMWDRRLICWDCACFHHANVGEGDL